MAASADAAQDWVPLNQIEVYLDGERLSVVSLEADAGALICHCTRSSEEVSGD